MPTYLCRSRPGALTAEQRADLATRITAVHSATTGAPRSFAQIVFDDVAADRHFIGGRPADDATVWVHGTIRSGRTTEVKNALVEGIRDEVCAVAGIDAEHVWVYLTELHASDMIEFGHVLPAAGAEDAWLAALPDRLRAWLAEPAP